MTKENFTPPNERGLTETLKGKSRRRREDISRLASAAAAATCPRRNDILPKLELVDIALDELQLPVRKVRNLDPAHVREVAGSISALGFCDPILIGKRNLVLDGVVRIQALRQLGVSHASCIHMDHLSEVEQRALRLSVNRLGEKGEWNLDELTIEFGELILIDAPIEIIGFERDEIDQIVQGEPAVAIEQGPLAVESGGEPVSRLGDVFQLGVHRVICGDATDAEVVRALMNGDPLARVLLTDEPYNVKISGHVTGGAHREFAMASGEMSSAEFLAFNEAWMEAALPCLCEGGVLATFIDWRGNPIVHVAATKLGLIPLNLIIWTKTNAGMGSLYRSQHELLPLFKNGDAPHVNNIQLGKKGRWRSNVWTYPGASTLGSDARRGLQDHPTVKPTAMLEDALLDLTNRGDIVLDPFLGSGSTLIAADNTGRVCRGVELDPLYVDVIMRRYEAASGKNAVLIETGESFVEISTRRKRDAASTVVLEVAS